MRSERDLVPYSLPRLLELFTPHPRELQPEPRFPPPFWKWTGDSPDFGRKLPKERVRWHQEERRGWRAQWQWMTQRIYVAVTPGCRDWDTALARLRAYVAWEERGDGDLRWWTAADVDDLEAKLAKLVPWVLRTPSQEPRAEPAPVGACVLDPASRAASEPGMGPPEAPRGFVGGEAAAPGAPAALGRPEDE
jgi:hypothetical protein